MPDGAVVGRCIVSATFEEWIFYVFNHPPAKAYWWREPDTIEWQTSPVESVSLLERTFSESGSLIKSFGDEQIGSGLWYICDISCSNVTYSLCDESVPVAARKNAIASLRNLYSDCFEIRCKPQLGHLSETDNPLNAVCYMLWDILPFRFDAPDAAHKEIDEEFLKVMEFALGLNCDACVESALHGLGHWAVTCPEHVRLIIDRFLEMHPDGRPELLAYARRARTGEIL